MQICVRKTGDDDRITCSNILCGLMTATDSSCGEIIFFSNRLQEEHPDVKNFLGLCAMLKITPDSVTVATSHPSAELIRNLGRYKIKRFMIAAMEENELYEAKSYEVEELAECCCDLLHYRNDKNSMSVCGAHDGRMVLGINQMLRFCLKNRSTCLHWRMYRKENEGCTTEKEPDTCDSDERAGS